MDQPLQHLVRQRAGERCEYCRMPQVYYRNRFPIDHILARQHGGQTAGNNLALACYQPVEKNSPQRQQGRILRDSVTPCWRCGLSSTGCYHCNSHKGPNIAGLDPVTGELTRLFHPREDTWSEHFAWSGPELVGLSSVGRATIAVLNLNDPDLVAVRAVLIEEGVLFME